VQAPSERLPGTAVRLHEPVKAAQACRPRAACLASSALAAPCHLASPYLPALPFALSLPIALSRTLLPFAFAASLALSGSESLAQSAAFANTPESRAPLSVAAGFAAPMSPALQIPPGMQPHAAVRGPTELGPHTEGASTAALQSPVYGPGRSPQGGFPTLQTEPGLRIFVTLAMPRESLKRLASQAASAGAVLVLRGLAHDSMRQTLAAIAALQAPAATRWQIDPPAFERYQVEQAPTFVLLLPETPEASTIEASTAVAATTEAPTTDTPKAASAGRPGGLGTSQAPISSSNPSPLSDADARRMAEVFAQGLSISMAQGRNDLRQAAQAAAKSSAKPAGTDGSPDTRQADVEAGVAVGSRCDTQVCPLPPPHVAVAGDVSLDYALGALARQDPRAMAASQVYLKRLSSR
jgi:type-F conjugative transfer system pilin assembly protein TrbC